MDLEDLETSDIPAFSFPSPIKTVDFNISDLAVFQVHTDTEVTEISDPVYQQFLADVWVGIVLTLMVLSCVCFMCSCLIYHKFQEWKHRVIEARNAVNLEAGAREADLPSYTIASGLPTYEEALEQLKKVKDIQQSMAIGVGTKTNSSTQELNECRRQEQATAPSSGAGNTLSVLSLFGIYNRSGECGSTKPS